ncbi:MAG: hypothetical protein MUD12_16310 [Spirochaetes bacterium]|nr:hypothetical protein [Spirochaetota bacterium]
MDHVMKRKLAFIRACCWIGVAADLAACVLLVSPNAARAAFGIGEYIPEGGYIYASRIGASLMLGWTFLLAWTAMDPAGRRSVLLLTVFPVLSLRLYPDRENRAGERRGLSGGA